MTEIIKFDHVTKRYGDKIVIDNLNFSIKTGEFITILGTSGSGKTTTLKMINRLIEPSSGAVIFDAIKASKSRGVDVLICDTAGRLHNKSNLMNELGKVFKIVDREYPEAKKEVLLVVDATTGQNAVSQAKSFKEVCDITGLVLTKLDGTAKGGVVLAVKSEVDVPVKLIGVGEQMEDLQDFDSKSFVDALFS